MYVHVYADGSSNLVRDPGAESGSGESPWQFQSPQQAMRKNVLGGRRDGRGYGGRGGREREKKCGGRCVRT